MLMSDIYDIPFSLPYGDGTSHTSDSCWPSTVFAPLRGWYCRVQPEVPRHCVFTPLRGWYGMAEHPYRYGDVFAPLRGWYPKYITEYRKMEEPDG